MRGPPRDWRQNMQELSDRGVACAPVRIRRIMAQRGLRAIQPKNFVPKTSDGGADKALAQSAYRPALA